MKKWIISIVLLVCLCACNSTATSSEFPVSQGSTQAFAPSPDLPNDVPHVALKKTFLTSSEGLPAFFTYLPEGWTWNVFVNYTVSERYPLQVEVNLVSGGEDCGIKIVTGMEYEDKTEFYTGERTPDDFSRNMLHYSTQLNYRNAEEYTDLMMNAMNLSWISKERQILDSDLIMNYYQTVSERANQSYEKTKANMSVATNGLSMPTSLTLESFDGDIAVIRGMAGTENDMLYIESQCYLSKIEIAQRIQVGSSYLGVNYTMGQDVTAWGPEYVSFYYATNEETFNDNYDMAQFIIQNSGTTAAFEDAKQQILNYMIPKIMQANEELINYGFQTMNQVMVAYEGTNERVAQMWDDYILDQDRYTASDGTQLIVPTTASSVYYNGSEVLWSNSPAFTAGPGYEQIR